MRQPVCRALVLVTLLVTIAACGDDEPITPTQPTLPSTTLETFSGTLERNGAALHAFPAHDRGTVVATLKSLSPEDTPIGLSLGTWNAASEVCQTALANDKAIQGTVVTGFASSLGNLCVRLYDATGALTQTTMYEVEVVHP